MLSLAQLICSPSKQAYSYLSLMHTPRHASLPRLASARMRTSAPCRSILDRHLPPKALVQCTALLLVLGARLVLKNFYFEIYDFVFGHIHGALNIIK